MVEHVLVPLDGSDPSWDALDFAVEEYPDAVITVLHVIDPVELVDGTDVDDGFDYSALLDNRKHQAENLLENARERAASRGAAVETDYLLGRVARSIVEYAEDGAVDHVVIGSHGRRGVSRILLGSVAENVTRRAPVPVTVVR